MDVIISRPPWCQEAGSLMLLEECLLAVQLSPVGAEVAPVGWRELGASADMLSLESERHVHADLFRQYDKGLRCCP